MPRFTQPFSWAMGPITIKTELNVDPRTDPALILEAFRAFQANAVAGRTVETIEIDGSNVVTAFGTPASAHDTSHDPPLIRRNS